MAEVTYTTVTWTAGDVITEAKMDNMVANDRAVDAMVNGVEFTERSDPSTPGSNKIHIYSNNMKFFQVCSSQSRKTEVKNLDEK